MNVLSVLVVMVDVQNAHNVAMMVNALMRICHTVAIIFVYHCLVVKNAGILYHVSVVKFVVMHNVLILLNVVKVTTLVY